MKIVDKSPNFVECVEKHNIGRQTIDHIYRWAYTTPKLEHTKRSRLAYRSECNIFEIWNIKIPDKDRGAGSSNGFRLLCYVVHSDEAITLDLIEPRKDQGSKKENKRDQQRYSEYLESLKTQLIGIYEADSI